MVIPAYNGALYIQEALDSVFRQTGVELEVIVVDDGSTDGTGEVVRNYRGGPVTYLRQPNRGNSHARNRGILASSGEFIAFQDQDDIWLDGKLAAQLPLFEGRPEVGLVYSDTYLLRDSRFLPDTIFRRFSPHRGRAFGELFLGSFIPMQTVVARRSCLEEVGLFNERLRIGGDYDLWLRVAARYELEFVRTPLAAYRIDGTGTSRNQEVALTEMIWILESISRDFPDLVGALGRRARRRLGDLHRQLGQVYLEAGNLERARQALQRSLQLDPAAWKAYLLYLVSLTGGGAGLRLLRGMRSRG
ncbi:MAG: glycosyltransferase [Candidatus Rokubacteria bacterium]|nr:glycosyltransferase [Candidatus Rokubacteria bacterium]